MPEYLAPGVFVEQVSYRSKSIEGVSTSTTAFVGATRKGPLSGSPEVITSVGDFERTYGGIDNLDYAGGATNYMAHAVNAYFNNGGRRLYVSRVFTPISAENNGVASVNITGINTTRFVARNPGSGYNGSIIIYEKRKLVTNQTRDNAPDGSLLSLASGSTDTLEQAAIKIGGVAPFNLVNGAALTMQVNGDESTITFEASNAQVTGGAADGNPDTTGLTFEVSVNGNAQQIVLPDGVTSLVDIVNLLNTQIRGAYVSLEGNLISVGTDLSGTSASISVSSISVLGFDVEDSENGSGNVANINNVSIDEISALAPETVNIVANANGNIVISTTQTGEDVTLAFTETSAMNVMGLSTEEVSGANGSTYTYFIKSDGAWRDNGDNPLVATPENVQELVLFNLEARDADGVFVSYEDLGFDANHPRFVGNVLREVPTSKSEELENPYYYEDNAALSAFALHEQFFAATQVTSYLLAGGNDGNAPRATSVDENAVTYADALELLVSIDDISILAAPGHSALDATAFATVQGQLISQCENLKYRYAVLDAPEVQTINEVRTVRAGIDTTYAALYYPWVTVANPLWKPGQDQISREINLPPSGFMAGIYARNDINRGVWKAPANEVIRGALRFERNLTTGQQEVLNPEGVNCLRYFFGRGYRVWGARSATSDPEYKYINLQRQMIYLQHSIDDSTQWAVFEPNGPRLWANITDTINSFLNNEWRNGALLGTTPEQAFQVRCGRDTMTQSNLDNGQLICEIGVALLRPAEFVIFRIGQKTADAQ